jgi:hypothetical protein
VVIISDFIKTAIERTNIQNIREFLLGGVQGELREEPYEIWLKKESDPIFKRLEFLYSENAEQQDEARNDLMQALIAYQSAYMEIGMKAGARLIYQLLLTDE